MKEVENLTLNDLLIKEFSPEEMKEKDKYSTNVGFETIYKKRRG